MFTLADCALRNVNATTVAASRHPDHRPLVTPAFPGSLQDFRHLAGFLFLRTVFAEYRRFPAVGFAVRSMKRGEAPRRKVQITNP